MSWLFSRALVEEYSAVTSSAGELSVQLSGNPMPLAFLPPDRMMAFSQRSLFGATFGHLTVESGQALLMWFLAGFPAKTSALQETVTGLTESAADSGEKWRGWFVKYDPDSCSWKTAQCSLLEGLEQFSETWPAWGLMRNGECFELHPLEQPTIDPAFTWLLTPTAQSWKAWTFRNPLALIRRNHADGNLQEQLMRLCQRMITPRCQEILMMWPEGWTDLKPLATARFRQWQQQHGIGCQESEAA
jgi:hypothetical protein